MNRFDLNLLIPFTVLIQEKHITRAANKLNISQSAMSKLLKKLREVFNDSLLVKTSHGMEITEYGLHLYQQVLPLLTKIDTLFEPLIQFHPSLLNKKIKIGMPNILADSLLQNIANDLNRQAPNVQIDVLTLDSGNIYQRLSTNEIDLAITYQGQFPETYKSTILFTETPVCMARRGHPLMKKKKINLQDYLKYEHIALVFDEISPLLLGDRLLKRMGFEKRNMKLRVRSPLSALSIISKNDMLLTISETFARKFTQDLKLDYRYFSTPLSKIPIHLVWSPIHDNSDWHKWVRSTIKQLLKETILPN